MNLRRTFLVSLIATTVIACKRKYEIMPAEAQQISRKDTHEAGEVTLREYKFTLSDKSKIPQIFLCESREFPDAESAKSAAKKNIAERPQEELKSENAHFAVSGRSLWLRTRLQLVWCMLSTKSNDNIPATLRPIKELFLQRYREAI